MLKRAVIGGTVSRITGGKFGNGAATSAFSALVDEAMRPKSSGSPAPGDSTFDDGVPEDLEQRRDHARGLLSEKVQSGEIDLNKVHLTTDAAILEIGPHLQEITAAAGVEVGGWFVEVAGGVKVMLAPDVGIINYRGHSIPSMRPTSANIPDGAVGSFHTHPAFSAGIANDAGFRLAALRASNYNVTTNYVLPLNSIHRSRFTPIFNRQGQVEGFRESHCAFGSDGVRTPAC